MMEVNIMNSEHPATYATFRAAYYGIRGILWLYSAQRLLVIYREKTVNASLLNAKVQFCCNCLTLSEKKISTSTSPLETQSIESDCRSRGCELAPG